MAKDNGKAAPERERRAESIREGNGVRRTRLQPAVEYNNTSRRNDRRAQIAPSENVLRPTRVRQADRTSAPSERDPVGKSKDAAGSGRPRDQTASDGSARLDRESVPEHVRARFVRVGRKYYFEDGARAFTDRGTRLTTPSENTQVIRSLVAIAQAREWQDITVSGSERFRREAWFSAKLAGLEVRGYRADTFEQARLARAMARGTRSDDSSSSSVNTGSSAAAEPKAPRNGREADGRLIVGRLIDHGRASYRHDSHEPMSYFAKVETARGERTLWGVDLERAFKESLTKPKVGDEIGLRAHRKDVVTVKAARRDANGEPSGEQEIQTHRNRWIVEKREFFTSRAAVADTVRNAGVGAREAVRDHPELAGTYLYLKAAEELAKRKIRDPQDQRRFVDTVRGALADSVARGDPLAAVRLRERGRDRTGEHQVNRARA